MMRTRRLSVLPLIVLLTAVQIVAPASGQIRTPTHTIAEARQLANGTTGVIVQGTISAPLYIFRPDEIWVQDATAGIDVYGVIPGGLQLGDLVEVGGTIGEYNGKKEIMPASGDVVLIDRGVPPAPIVTNTGSIGETSEGWLVVITGTVSGYSGGTDSTFSMNDGTGSATIYRDTDTGIDLTWIQNGDLLTLVGISSQYDTSPPYTSGYQVLPRYQQDIAKGLVQPIALARQQTAGMTVTIQGAVTLLPGTFEPPANNRELHIQDGTGGVSVYKGSGLPIPSGTLSYGDIVTVTGQVGSNNGKMQIVPTAVVTRGLVAAVVPKIQFAGNIGEATEGLLVVVSGTVSNKWGAYDSGFDLTDATGTTAVFVDGDTGVDLSGIDNGDAVRVTGLSAQYDTTPPYDSGYQIQVRIQSDIALTTGDFDPPGITATVPISNATDANPYLPVKAIFDEAMDASTIDETTFALEDASGPVSGVVYYDSGRWTAVFDPEAALAAGTTYTATVKGSVEDKAGNPMGADYVWVFTTTGVTFNAYHGSIHNHTSYSDGTADPDTAFTAGRDRGLDFMAVTDHSYAISDPEWEDTLAQAISHTVDGVYVAIRGCEYTHGTEGHLNVYNTIRHPVRTDYGYGYADYAPTLAAFYDWLAQHPEATGLFNHPGWMNFNDWAYRSDVEEMMQLLEIGNGAYSYYVWTEAEYLKALDYGWKVGPSNNGDTHTDEWAIDNPGRTGIWATELTYDGVLEALDAMRTFATEDTNLEIYLKGDGAWMGETIPNDGAIDFEIYVDDPDGEDLVSLSLYTDQGQVATATVPAALPYTWTFSLSVSEGVHYYFAHAVQDDGDRTVSSPIWTAGDVDVSPTKLEITPAQLSTQAPANFKARITNRGIADAPGITVTFRVDTTVVGTQVITVPAGGDAFASIGWAPDVTGTVAISAEIENVPAGDNPDDNTISAQRRVVDYPVPLIVIDNGHDNNVFVSGSAEDFKNDLVAHGFNWIEDTDGITTTDLASAVLLIISDPGSRGEDLYTDAEEQAIADYVNNGGALLLAGDSDYHDHGNPEEFNAILDKITGAGIRMNSDGTYDDTNQGGVGPWHVLWHVFPSTLTTGIAVNVEIVVGFSGCSIYGVDDLGTPVVLTTGNGITLTVVGDDDTYQNDGDNNADHFVYPPGTVIPMAAVQALPTGGRIAVWGDSNESFSDAYTYVPADGYQNEIYNMETIYWLLGRPLQKWTIAEARYDAELDDTPDHMPDLVWIEGQVTAKYGNFFDVMYVQDDTGGVTIYAPVAGLPAELGQDTALGKWVRIVGRLDTYQGDTEIMIAWDPEQAQIIGDGVVPEPLVLDTYEAALEENEGWLMQTDGLVIEVWDDYNLIIDDGSGPCRVFIDGYNGSFAGAQVGDWAWVVGLGSEDGNGQRIRVRDQGDVTLYEAATADFTASPTAGIAPFMVTFTNTSIGVYTDSLWSFGDGITSTVQHPTHTYGVAGVYTVTLTVSGLGGENSAVKPSYITAYEAVSAGFSASPLSGTAPLVVTFTNTSTGDYTDSLWDFGDGITSTLAHPTHTYNTGGTFTVTLTVSGPGGMDTEVKPSYIMVIPVYRIFLPLIVRGWQL